MSCTGVIRRRSMGGKNLPYDAEITYLKGGSKAWIDTGISGNSDNIEITVDFTAASGFNSSSKQAAFGNFTLEYYKNQAGWSLYQRYGTGEWTTTAPTELQSVNLPAFTLNKRYIAVVGPYQKTKLRLYDSDSWITNTTGGQKYGTNSTSNILLFVRGPIGISNGVVTNPCALQIHAVTIKKGGSIVRDFIPVRVGTVGYMYDTVSKTLFGNAGAGSFTLGEDK